MKTIVFAGGGTAGHVEPALSVAEQWMKENPEDKCIFIGTAHGLETTLVPAAGFTLRTIKRVVLTERFLHRRYFYHLTCFRQLCRHAQ
jgi:UDP-N-acetylglucosamine--N-acetylmuramyl-(pentapeptide) pyrophosphoryl-undecaprenol N-acetylglucosamine transferase